MVVLMITTVFGLFVLMVAYGIFIPLAMIPIPVNLLLPYRHPELIEAIQKVTTFEEISILVVMLLIGALVSVYGAHTTHLARKELFEAKQLDTTG